MKEIGGYFGLDSMIGGNGEYYTNLVSLNSARNALVYLVRTKKIRKIYIPLFLCDSVSMVCDREGIPYEYYHTDEYFLPVFDRRLCEAEYLYVVNYYGQFNNNRISALKEKYQRIILDNVQAFFQQPAAGIDTIYSCRKFFGVPDGAYLSTDCLSEEILPEDCSAGRTGHIYGRIRDGASAHYAEFQANDEAFKALPLMKMSELTHRMLSKIDYETVRTIREENFLFLQEQLEHSNRLSLQLPEGPYAYPFYCENGVIVRKKLAQKKIYIATLWPNVSGSDANPQEKDYAENILPLPCDQRYGIDDLKSVLEEIQKCTNI